MVSLSMKYTVVKTYATEIQINCIFVYMQRKTKERVGIVAWKLGCSLYKVAIYEYPITKFVFFKNERKQTY